MLRIFYYVTAERCVPGSSVGILTGYGLDRSRIESRWGRGFSHMSRRALGPSQPPVQWLPGLSRGKAAGTWCWPPTPFCVEVTKGLRYTSIDPLGQFRLVTGLFYLHLLLVPKSHNIFRSWIGSVHNYQPRLTKLYIHQVVTASLRNLIETKISLCPQWICRNIRFYSPCRS
jgi:hypothetical protein